MSPDKTFKLQLINFPSVYSVTLFYAIFKSAASSFIWSPIIFQTVKGFFKPKSLENVIEEDCLKLETKENVTFNYKWSIIFHTSLVRVTG
jgi:hypothetical protein